MFFRVIFLSKTIRNFNINNFKILLILLTHLLIIFKFLNLHEKCVDYFQLNKIPSIINSKGYHRNVPILFISGEGRSGVHLIKTLLNSYPSLACENQNHEVSSFLSETSKWYTKQEMMFYKNAGISKENIENSVGAFLLEFISANRNNNRFCYIQASSSFFNATLFSKVLPNSKFILMVRNPLASIISSFNSGPENNDEFKKKFMHSLKHVFERWNFNMEIMHEQCKSIGSKRCQLIYYEDLILNLENEMKKIIKFLWNIPWSDSILEIKKDTEENIDLSSPDTTSWVKYYPKNAIEIIRGVAPMFEKLGYDKRY